MARLAVSGNSRGVPPLVILVGAVMLLFTGYQLRDMRITGGGAPTAGPSPVVLSGGSPAAAGGAVPATSVPAAAGAAAAAASSATRRLVFDTPYGRDAVQKLGEWRSSLFARMAEFYKAEEAAQSQQGAVQVGRVEPQGVRRYNLFDAFIGCPAGQIQRLGPPGDGGKFVCVDGVLTHLQGAAKGAGDQERCAIYSIGSAGDFEFERSMLQSTTCDVFTFDCTYDGASVDPARHQYHKVCMGGEGKTKSIKAYGGASDIADAQFMTWDQTTAMLKLSRVHLLKIDIEGFEFDVLSALKEANSCDLPLMIAMEVHFVGMYNGGNQNDFTNLFWSGHDVSLGELAVWFGHFANLGYALISREDNPYGMHCCAEFTLLRVEQPAECLPFATEAPAVPVRR